MTFLKYCELLRKLRFFCDNSKCQAVVLSANIRKTCHICPVNSVWTIVVSYIFSCCCLKRFALVFNDIVSCFIALSRFKNHPVKNAPRFQNRHLQTSRFQRCPFQKTFHSRLFSKTAPFSKKCSVFQGPSFQTPSFSSPCPCFKKLPVHGINGPPTMYGRIPLRPLTAPSSARHSPWSP